MNAEQIVGRATQEEVLDLVREIIPSLTEENLYAILLETLTDEQIEELYIAYEQKLKARR